MSEKIERQKVSLQFYGPNEEEEEEKKKNEKSHLV